MSTPSCGDLPAAEQVLHDVRGALEEDIGSGDVTAQLIPEAVMASATIITRESAVIAGSAWADACFRQLDPEVVINWQVHDGIGVVPNAVLCILYGQARALLSAERCALNFLQTLSGTATTTAKYVDAVRGTRVTLLDTRKTLPGLRLAQKYAVRVGGGGNHRIGLYDAFLIKENHIAAAGSLTLAVHQARVQQPQVFLEVEVESFAELREALQVGVDRILLDEFSLDELRVAVTEVAGSVPLEVSGGVNLESLSAIAATGVDYISIGALTKHVRAIDLSMRIECDISHCQQNFLY